MNSRTLSRPLRSVVSVSVCLLAFACKREQGPVNMNEVERCERGIERAVLEPEVKNALKMYYRECAGIYTEPACKQAFTAAAELEPSQQMPKIMQDCKTAYCPLFQGRNLEACQPNFEITPMSTVKAWPPLHDAILARDAKGFAPRISRSMLVFYSRVTQRMGQPAGTPGSPLAGSAPPPSGSAPAASASAPAAPSASAPAAPSASAAKAH
jgi:hypothetical protein